MKLNKRSIDKATYQGPGADYRWDTDIAGFGLRIYPSGRKSYVVTYRCRGRQRFYTLGRHGELTPYQARTEALETLARTRRGEDPSAERAGERGAPTVTDLWDRYRREYIEVRLKPETQRRLLRLWPKHILPRFGERKVSDVARSDVAKLMSEMAATPMEANAVRKALSAGFNMAEVWGWRSDGTNPCKLVQMFKEETRERFLSEEELGRLAEALATLEEEDPKRAHTVAAIRLLILTGCRRSEILGLRWQDVDFERRCLRLPDSKTGAKVVFLNTVALELLAGIERIEGNPHVIPGRAPGSHLRRLDRTWDAARKQSGLEDVRLHDLRHTYASFGVGTGLSLPLVGRLLGHSRSATTERYAHLADDPVRQAAEQIGSTIEAAMQRRPKASVVKIGR